MENHMMALASTLRRDGEHVAARIMQTPALHGSAEGGQQGERERCGSACEVSE